jgi:dephospho-CoA kinase
MKLCGLTGGVGMGKSTAAGFFLQRGVRVVDTDALAHELVEPGQPALAEIQREFGSQLLAVDGRLKRAELARLVFADADARRRLESILHPRIRECWQAQVEQWRRENGTVAMVVIPLLYETGAEMGFDHIICVACSPVEQRARLAARGWPVEQVQGRIAAQFPIEQKIARAQFVIWTEGSVDQHQRQVEAILGRLAERA